MADSPSTGGFWQWDMMLHPYIEAYDPVTRTAYVPCYQSGCRHNDSTCSACFGNLSALAEYRDSLYALVLQDGESAASLVSRPLSGGALRVLASWEPENEGEKYRCALRCISFGKAYLTVTRAAYLPEDGQLTRDEQENRLVSVDLQTGEEATILEHAENYDLYGVWGDCAVFQVQETAEGAPDFADWAAQQPEEASWDEYERLYIRYRILSRDLRTGVETTIVDGRSLLSGRRTRIGAGENMPCIRSVAAFMSTTWRRRRPKSSLPTSRNGNSTTICFWTAMRSSCAERRTPVMPGRSTLRTAP